MKTIEKINELQAKVNSALTAEASGRQIVADCCKELYKTIEEDVHNAGAGWVLKGMYEDLCQGNFAEPFTCERKKVVFAVIKKIYEDNILPRLMQKSKIEEIHESGLVAIIDGDILKIVGTCKPEHVERQIQELQASGYSDVSIDIEGDIIAYGRDDNP